MHTIVFLDAFTNNPGDISFDALYACGHVHIYDRTTRDQVQERAAEAEILIVNKFVIDDTILQLLPRLRYIIVAATGYNNIDLEACRSREITVSNVRGYSTSAVVQHVFSLIFALTNKVEYYDRQVKENRWSRSVDFCFYDHGIHELAGKTLGIIGFGAIGAAVARVGEALGMRIIVHTRSPMADTSMEWVDLETLWAESDILSLHCPLTETTKHIVNKLNLKKMKPTSLLINTGRGPLVDENALFYALDHGVIAGAGLDVLSVEPPHMTHTLMHHSRAVVTPHIAWASVESRERLMDGIVDNIKQYQAGQPSNVVS
jgi:glycerate dehydrogenase